jgi:hypothetical protein
MLKMELPEIMEGDKLYCVDEAEAIFFLKRNCIEET